MKAFCVDCQLLGLVPQLGNNSTKFQPGGIAVRLSRKQIKEALDQIPVEQVLLGSVGAKEVKLTSKQKEFARQVALGETKAAAYRKSRNTKAKPETASKRGQELAKHGAVAAQIEAFKLAFEAQKYTSPAHLRALAIQQLTEHSLNPEFPPAQRVKCLELIGKMTEVSLFTERREIVQVTDSSQIKDRLMETLRTITQADATDVDDTAAESLLAELSEPMQVSTPDTYDDQVSTLDSCEPEPTEPEPAEPGPVATEPEQAPAPSDI